MFRTLFSRFVFAMILATAFMLNGCAPADITASWKSPEYQRGEIRSVLVVGISKNETVRRTFEDAMTSRLEQYGIEAEPGYRTISADELADKKSMNKLVKSREAGGVLISRIVDTHTEEVVRPGRTTAYHDWPYYWRRSYWSGIDPYRGWYPYYRSSYEIIHEPARVSRVKVVTIETTLYSVESDEPVWSVRAEMRSEGKLGSRIERFTDQLIDNMVDKGVI